MIDEIGGLDDCIAAAAKKAKLEKYEVIHRPLVKSGFDLLEILGEEENNDIEIKSMLSTSVFKTLAQQGFDMRATKALIDSCLEPRSPRSRLGLAAR